MKESIYNLVKLQDKDNEIRALKSKLIQIPKEIDALEKEIAVEKDNLNHAERLLKKGTQEQRTAESTSDESASRRSENSMRHHSSLNERPSELTCLTTHSTQSNLNRSVRPRVGSGELFVAPPNP